MELCVEVFEAETGSLVGVERQYIGRNVDTSATTDDDEVGVMGSASAVRLDKATDVHGCDVGTQFQHPHVNYTADGHTTFRKLSKQTFF